MLRRLLVWGGIVLVGCIPGWGMYAQDAVPRSASRVGQYTSVARTLLSRYCITCHNENLATAGLTLDALDLEDVGKSPAVWEKVVHKLRSGAMPPVGMPRPDTTGYMSLITYLETELDRASATDPNPGRPAVHRLNRAEYVNAIRDLLAIDVDPELLPIDELNHGFDNMADVLSVTPVLFERYLSAARRVARMAVGEPEVRPYYETYEIRPFLSQDDRMSDDLPFGSRGGMVIRHHFPLDAEYTVRVFLQRNSRDYIRGLAEPHQLDFRLDGKRLAVLTVGGGAELEGEPGPPFSQAAQIGDSISETYEHGGAEEHLEVRFEAKAGTRPVGVTFMSKNTVDEGVFRPPLTRFQRVQFKGGNPQIDKVVISGPYDPGGLGETQSREKIFVCRPDRIEDEAPCAQRILETLARRAYRRPVTDRNMDALLHIYEVERNEAGFEAGVQAALERILVGPEFLFRIERDPPDVPPDTVYRISDLELASRLSFFLWSSIPDDELLNLAESGQLADPVALEQQVRRMLGDSRSGALVTNFAAQWLQLRNIRSKTPDPVLFPEFDENLREAFRKETELFLESTLREDQSVLELLDADYTFLNERLAAHYGMPNVYGSHFRRVTLGPEFEARRGLLGHGSLLTVTSYANRTSAVLRGKWVLDTILGAPPPAPPPAVPVLEDSKPEGEPLPLRQLMEKHRANPGCAGCHAQMDPLGFALENFDAVGRWRTTDAGEPIDASGVLPDGTTFDGPNGLRNELLNQREEFLRGISEKMLTYALGRGLQYYDAPAVRQIVRESAREDYRWSALILATVRSMPFQMRGSTQP